MCIRNTSVLLKFEYYICLVNLYKSQSRKKIMIAHGLSINLFSVAAVECESMRFGPGYKPLFWNLLEVFLSLSQNQFLIDKLS